MRSLPLKAGKHKIGIITRMKEQAIMPIGLLNLPKCHGPRRKRSPTKNVLMKIGIVKATYAAMAPTEKIAPIATGPPKIKRSKQMPIVVLNQTALTGVYVILLTLLIHQEPGKQPSRAYAKVTLDAATIHPWPMEKAQTIVKARTARAIFWGMTWMRYEAHGWPRSDPTTDGISMTVYATTNCNAQPAIPPVPAVITMARGDAMLALLHL